MAAHRLALPAYAVLVAATYLAVRWRAGTVRRRSDVPAETAFRLRRLRRLGYLLGGGAAVALSVAADLPDSFDAVLSGVAPVAAGTPPVVVVATAVALLGPAFGATLAVYLAALPHRRAVRELDQDAADAVRWFVAHLPAPVAGLVVAVAVVLGTPPGLPRVLVVGTLSLASTAVLPVLLAHVVRARSPTAREAAVAGPVLDDTAVRLRVMDDRSRAGSAFAAGVVPGTRTVFVAAGLFDVLPPDELRAVVAHEVAHHRRGHVLARYLLVAGPVVALVAAIEFRVPGAAVAGAALAVPYLLLFLRYVRHTEYEADADAAGAVGDRAMAGALDRLAGARLVMATTGRVAEPVAAHPSIRDRVARLGGAGVSPRPDGEDGTGSGDAEPTG